MKAVAILFISCVFIFGVAAEKSSRVLGGKPAIRKLKLPTALLRVTTRGGHERNCTGTVVGRRFIVSAAHCFDRPASAYDLKVNASFANIGIFDADPPTSAKNYTFKRVHIHKGFRTAPNNFRHNIAVVELKDEIKRLYRQIKIGNAPSPGAAVLAVGYGDVDWRGRNATYVGQTYMRLQRFGSCKAKESTSVQRFLRKRLMLCAGSVKYPNFGITDVCDGDDGGPLFQVTSGKRAVQFGITSFSTSACGTEGGVAWFTRLSTYKKNIRRIVQSSTDSNFRVVEN